MRRDAKVDAAPLLEATVRWAHDPLGFVTQTLKAEPDAWQRDVLHDIGTGLATPDEAVRIAVASGHGVGKSALVAWILLWAIGVDVARFGDDRSVIFVRKGIDARSRPPLVMRGVDTMTLSGRVVEVAAQHRADAVFVDEGGVGGGVVDRLRQLGVPRVIGVNFAGKPDGWAPEGTGPLFANKRAEIWGRMKEWLKAGAIPGDPALAQDLTGVEYGYDARNAIQLERKDDMKKRGLASPDLGDALALTFAPPVHPLWQQREAGTGPRILDRDDDYDLFHDL